MGKRRLTKAQGQSLADKLRERDVDPVAKLLDMATFSMALTAEEARHEVFRELLESDYELVQCARDPAKPWRLQTRLKVRSGIFQDMLSYVHPRLRVSEHHGTVDHTFQVVEIKTFPVLDAPAPPRHFDEVPAPPLDAKHAAEPRSMSEIQPEDETALA